MDPRVRPILAVSFTYGVFSTFWVYVGVFAVKSLGARPSQVGLMFLLSAPAAAAANFASGAVSDRVGRRSLIAASFAATAVTMAALSLARHNLTLAFALVILQGVAGAPAYCLDRVLVADFVVEPDAREHGYAAVRVASNLGTLIGPPLAALVIQISGWGAYLLALTVVALAGTAVTLAALPRGRTHTRSERAPRGALRLIANDRSFVLLLVSTLLGFAVYVGYETVLPVIAVSNYGLSPSTWGVLLVIAPLTAVLAQLRVTSATAGVPARRRLAAALLLMGLPFLILSAAANTAVIAGVIVVFVLGEMLWVPTYQALAAELAPRPLRGTYFGALAATTGPAWTLVPLIAMQLRTRTGVDSVWVFFAATALAGAAIGVSAARGRALSPARRERSGRPPGWRSARDG
jgi:predicted MFS family arabinose efflux permease